MDAYSESIQYYSEKEPHTFSSLKSGFWVLLVTILGSSMAFIDSTAVNTTLPLMQRGLNVTITEVLWIIEGYVLFISSLSLFGGSLGDRYGTRKIFILGLIVISVSFILCRISLCIRQLILARALQGIGGALLVPRILAFVNVSFDNQRRGRATGV